ncbi:hypothetical protein D3C74_396630 [compost metagenome]
MMQDQGLTAGEIDAWTKHDQLNTFNVNSTSSEDWAQEDPVQVAEVTERYLLNPKQELN